MQYILDSVMARTPHNYKDDLFRIYNAEWNAKIKRLQQSEKTPIKLSSQTVCFDGVGDVSFDISDDGLATATICQTGAIADLHYVNDDQYNMSFRPQWGGNVGSANWGQVILKGGLPTRLQGKDAFSHEFYNAIAC
jgi:hypothetical protein